MQLGELCGLSDGNMGHREYRRKDSLSLRLKMFIFTTHPMGQSSLGEPNVLRFCEKAPETAFVLSLLSSPVAMAGAEQAGVPKYGPRNSER